MQASASHVLPVMREFGDPKRTIPPSVAPVTVLPVMTVLAQAIDIPSALSANICISEDAHGSWQICDTPLTGWVGLSLFFSTSRCQVLLVVGQASSKLLRGVWADSSWAESASSDASARALPCAALCEDDQRSLRSRIGRLTYQMECRPATGIVEIDI